MKIAVYGATGMVGSEIAAEAVRRGHEVTAISRSATEVAGASARAAELSELAVFREIAEGNDVVVLAVAPDRTGGSHDGYLAAHAAIASSRVNARVFVVGGAGSLIVDGAALHEQPGFPDAFKPEAVTMGAILDTYRASSDLDWTMLSPAPQIGPGERTGAYRIGTDSPVGDSVSSQDFAVAVLDELEAPAHRGARFTVAGS